MGSRARPLPRSYLYVPGDDARKLAGVLSRDADAVIVDLEDSVATSRKCRARTVVNAWLSSLDRVAFSGTEIWVRIGEGETASADLEEVFHEGLTGVCIPKVSALAQVARVAVWLDELEPVAASGEIRIQPLIETALGVLSAPTVAKGERVQRLQLGEVDLGAELRAKPDADEHEFLFARSQIVLASAAAGIASPVGPVSANFTDLDQFRLSTENLKRLGYRARACIHPSQVAIANEVFYVSESELAEAAALVEVGERAASEGSSGVWRGDRDEMVDEASIRAARRLLADNAAGRRTDFHLGGTTSGSAGGSRL